jgi:hypothetical protein
MKIKIYIEADFDEDTPVELVDEQAIQSVVADNLQLTCRELGLSSVSMTQFDIEYGDN